MKSLVNIDFLLFRDIPEVPSAGRQIPVLDKLPFMSGLCFPLGRSQGLFSLGDFRDTYFDLVIVGMLG